MQLKVVAVSTNTNSFGLRRMCMISDTGHGFAALVNDINVRPEGYVFRATRATTPEQALDELVAQGRGWECAERVLPDPSPELLAEVWPGVQHV